MHTPINPKSWLASEGGITATPSNFWQASAHSGLGCSQVMHTPIIPVEAGLPAMGPADPISSLTDLLLSLASQLLQRFASARAFVQVGRGAGTLVANTSLPAE
jgi:hypothetical protein